MIKDILSDKKHIHLIGIGGSGMYPLAQILRAKGFYLTGSDNNETETLAAVRSMGIPVQLGQRAENIGDADLIVYSAAIMADNPELVAAQQSGAEVMERSELLGLVTSWYDNAICVAGTHGKTTTTSMLVQVFMRAGLDISAVIGGKLPAIGGSGRAGESDIMVCEACEFVDTFLHLYPDTAVILNIDADHLDYFKTLENIIASFRKFCDKASRTIIFNGDDANSIKAVSAITGKNLISFGLGSKCRYRAEDIRRIAGASTVYALWKEDVRLGEITLNVAGEHNILNSLAAAAAALESGAGFADVAAGLAEFTGAGRRFEKIAEACGITIVDDYAHHPAEIAVTLKAAKDMGFRHIWAVFQPFTFSRTAMLLDDFAQALSIADTVILTDIMGSREKNTYDIYSRDLGRKIDGCIWFEDNDGHLITDEDKKNNFTKICALLKEKAQSGDLVITMGCGDVYKLAKQLAGEYNEG